MVYLRLSSLGVAALGLSLASAAVGTPAQPALNTRACAGDVAHVAGATAADLADICAGVTSAITFLSRLDVRPTEPVSIEITPTLPKEASATAAGCYIEKLRKVYLVPYSTFRANKTWFGVSINRQLYRALAAHEAAHAVGACSFRIPNPTIQAKEYLAYVTMFSVMPAALRSQVLRKVHTEGFESLDRFTPLLYSFDPMRFGAEAYGHFSAASDQRAIVESVLAGRVLHD